MLTVGAHHVAKYVNVIIYHSSVHKPLPFPLQAILAVMRRSQDSSEPLTVVKLQVGVPV